MTKIKLTCMKCGKKIKLDFTSNIAMCKKCQKESSKAVIIDDFLSSD